MGLKTWLQGHGWDGTRGPLADQRREDIRVDVEAFKARYAEPDVAQSKAQAEAHLRATLAQVQRRAEEVRTRSTVIREFYEHGEVSAPHKERAPDRIQGWER